MTTKLKPCPFCGDVPTQIKHGAGCFFIECTNNACGCSPRTSKYIAPSNAVDDWNSRTANANVTDLVIAINELFKALHPTISSNIPAMYVAVKMKDRLDELINELGVRR